MNKIPVIRLSILLLLCGCFYACDDSITRPDVRIIPLASYSLTPEAYLGTDTTFHVGAEKGQEIESNVIYKIEINASEDLTFFKMSSSSDAVSPESKVIRTIPANVIDNEGNFTKPVKNVVVYYNYYILRENTPGIPLVLTFSIQDKKYGEKVLTHTLIPLRAGSSSGNPLTVINNVRMTDQFVLDRSVVDPHPGLNQVWGTLFSLDLNSTYQFSVDIPDKSYIDMFLCYYMSDGTKRIALASHQADIVKNDPKLAPLIDDTIHIRFKRIGAVDRAVFDQLTHDNELAGWYSTPGVNPAVQTPDLVAGDIFLFERYTQRTIDSPALKIRRGVLQVDSRSSISGGAYSVVFNVKFQP